MNANRKIFTASLLLPASLVLASCSSRGEAGSSDPADDPTESVAASAEGTGVHVNAVTEAPAGFDNFTNGFESQTAMDADNVLFAESEGVDDGLGPVYNAQSCRECHQNPVVGAGSQVNEFRAGHFNGLTFVEHPGGSLLNDRAIDPAIQERIAAGQEVRTFRASISLMGDGFVEAIDSNTLQAIASSQPSGQRGTVIQVPVLEAGNSVRVGRFGWKNQHASVLSFAADAYINEMGITTSLQPTENTSNGASVAGFDEVADPEDDGDEDVTAFARFIRSLKAPPRDAALAATASAQHGSQLFDSIGCAVCHVRSITTAPAGTVINAGAFTVPKALGDKIIHPFSDFLLHDVGTGDGIVQNGGSTSRNKVRTAALWGMRARDRLMHDGETVSRSNAIDRHGGQAAGARDNFDFLSTTSQNDLINFLNSL